MIERHYAFFRQGTGDFIREWRGPVEAPDIDPRICGERRVDILNAWATAVSRPEPGEVGLDVTHYDRPVGDFRYCRFNEVDRILEYMEARTHIELRCADAVIVGNVMGPRGIATSAAPGQVVLDTTGTPWARYHGQVFGRLVSRGGSVHLDPTPADRACHALVTRHAEVYETALPDTPRLALVRLKGSR